MDIKYTYLGFFDIVLHIESDKLRLSEVAGCALVRAYRLLLSGVLFESVSSPVGLQPAIFYLPPGSIAPSKLGWQPNRYSPTGRTTYHMVVNLLSVGCN